MTVTRAASGAAAARVLAGLVTATLLAASGGSAEAQRLNFIRDTEIEKLLSDYSKPIFRAAGLGGGRIRMRVVRDDGFNAFVLDGRNVFINTGTLMIANTPNEVIGVIAHETGHIAGGHMAGLRAKIKRDTTRLLLMKILGIGALAAGAATGGTNSDVAGGIGKTLLGASDPMVMRSILSYRRVQESAADQAAVRYLNRTKQSSQGMLTTFERFAQQDLFSSQLQDPYVRSHPMAQQRISQLRTLATGSAYYGSTDAPELQLRHDLMRAKLSGYLEKPGTVLNRYPPNDGSLPALYARAIAAFFSGGLNKALPKIEQLIAQRSNYPYFHELKGDLLVRGGRPAQAVEPLRRALKLGGGSDLIRIRLAQALLATKSKRHTGEAVKLLRKALVNERSASGYRQLASAYWQQGREGDAFLASAQAHYFSGRIGEAKRFAKRAQLKFKKGSPSWVKADDILKFQK